MSSVLERMERQAVLLEKRSHQDDIDFLVEYERREWRERHLRLKASGDPIASFLTGTNVELIYASKAPGTAKNTFTTEVQINDTAGMGNQAVLPAKFWNPAHADRTGIRIVAHGILGTTGAPTFTWTCRLGAAASTTAAIALGTAALTAGTGVATKGWEFEGDFVLETLAAAGANSTGRGAGMVTSPLGLASPFAGELWGGGTQPGTVATVDASIDNFINFNVACSASSASNTITLLQLLVYGLN